MTAIPDTHEQRLRAAGLRVTRPRLAVLDVLDEAAGQRAHLPVSDIVQGARERLGDVSTQAVYDCLDALGSSGLVRRVETAGSPARYESRAGDNHHHLVCRSCGHTEDVDCVVGSAPCLQPSDSHGFVLDEAEVVFWGQCSQCQ
jgi:Fe2+ or Zn2+ uptake regulation protein